MLKDLLDEKQSVSDMEQILRQEVVKVTGEEIAHTIKFMLREGLIVEQDQLLALNVQMDDQLREYMEDLLEYGLTQYESTYKHAEKFVLWHNYRKDQVQRKLLKTPGDKMKGTYFYDDYALVFAGLKKDASLAERLQYKDKFLAPNLFQWECENNISQKDLQALRLCKYVYLFIRKVDEEHGVRLPFTYVGDGKFDNERKQLKEDSSTGKQNVTYLYDIHMDETLPDYLQYDFGLSDMA